MRTLVLLHLLFVLHQRAHQLPDVQDDRLDAFVSVAVTEATRDVPASLLVALAWGESRFDPMAQPGCGAMQVFPRDIDRPHSDCDVWRTDLRAGVRAGVVEIEMLLADHRVKRNMRRALLYRACGNAFFTGMCSKAKVQWVEAAIARWKWLSENHVEIGT